MKLKKIIILSIAFCSLMTIGKVSASIDESILSSDFPDENFRTCIVNAFNEKEPNFDESSLTKAQFRRYLYQKTTELDCSNKGITSTEGIKYLIALQKLDLSNQVGTSYKNNNLGTIDVSKNTALTSLNLSNNNLSTINLSENTLLEELNLSYNNLGTIDVSKNTALTSLSLSNNKISTIDLSKNTSLQRLDLHSNKISAIDLSKNNNLTTFSLINNNFSYPTETKYGLGKLTLGEKLSFKEYVKLPQRFKTKVSYTSSNPEIATVDENGNISGVKEGTVTITLTSKDRDSNLIYEVNEVTVTKKVVPESTTEKTNNEKTEAKNVDEKSVKNPETSDKGMIYGGGLTLTIGTIIAIRKKLKLLEI